MKRHENRFIMFRSKGFDYTRIDGRFGNLRDHCKLSVETVKLRQ